MNAVAYWFVNTMESEASAIARGLHRRDPDLLDRLIEQYQHRLFRYLVYLSGNRELAEDLFRNRFACWNAAINTTASTNQHVALRGGGEFDHRLFADEKAAQPDGLMEDDRHAPLEPADPRPMAWEVVQQHEQAERISAALVSIPAEYRETVVLRFQEGLPLDEIATITGTKLGTVKSRLYRGLNMLMSQLKGAQA